jgi:aryl-alcohol dehydrogenase-like predicted oxidoreductase
MRTVPIELPNATAQLPRASVLGLGCAAMLGRTGRRDSLTALAAAYDAGITFYDTARSYGYGACEGLLGEFFAGRKRESVLLCTKFGILPASSGGWKQRLKPLARAAIGVFPGLRSVARRQAADQFVPGQFSVATLRSSLETSLRELKTDYVDILLLHAAPIGALAQDDLMEEMERMRDAGKLRIAGISGEQDVIAAAFAQRPPVLQTAQFALNVFNMEFSGATAKAAPSMFLVANHPFGGRDGVSECRERIARMRMSSALPESLRMKLAADDDLLLPEVVLNSILTGTGISVVIPAMMQPKHLRSNIQAVESCRFSPEELAVLRTALCAED